MFVRGTLQRRLLGSVLLALCADGAVALEQVVAPKVYAQELLTPGAAVTDDGLDVLTTLGFGVTAFDTRFIRFDLVNGQFNGQVTLNDLQLFDAQDGGALDVLITVESGGAAGSSSVTFRVVSLATFGPGARVSFELGSGGSNGVRITALAEGQKRTLRYAVYDSMQSAASEVLPLDAKSLDILETRPGLAFAVADNRVTISIRSVFREFSDTADVTDGFINSRRAQIGRVLLSTQSGVSNRAGVQVLLSDLITSESRIRVRARGLNAFQQVTLDRTIPFDCADAVAASSRSESEAVFNNGNQDLNQAAICLSASGLTRIDPGAVSLEAHLVGTPQATVPPLLTGLLGTLVRDGASLKVPYLFFNNNRNIVNFLQIGSTAITPAPYFVDCIGPDGSLIEASTGVLMPNISLRLTRNDLNCAAPADAAIILIDARSRDVFGTQVRINSVTGDAGFDKLVSGD